MYTNANWNLWFLELLKLLLKPLKKILNSSDIDSFTITKSKNKPADCIIVLGGDKGVRNYFHRTFDSTSPVLGINEGESSGFFSSN